MLFIFLNRYPHACTNPFSQRKRISYKHFPVGCGQSCDGSGPYQERVVGPEKGARGRKGRLNKS